MQIDQNQLKSLGSVPDTSTVIGGNTNPNRTPVLTDDEHL